MPVTSVSFYLFNVCRMILFLMFLNAAIVRSKSTMMIKKETEKILIQMC